MCWVNMKDGPQWIDPRSEALPHQDMKQVVERLHEEFGVEQEDLEGYRAKPCGCIHATTEQGEALWIWCDEHTSAGIKTLIEEASDE